MKTLSTTRSMQHYHNELVYTEAALGASLFTAPLTGSYGELVDEWFDYVKKQRDARQAVTRANAVLHVKDQVLDWTIRKFVGVLLVEVNQNRESTLFRRFFPIQPSKLVRQPLVKQIDYTKSSLVPEIDTLEEGHALKAHKDEILAAALDAEEALKKRARVIAVRKSVSYDMEEWKSKVNTLRMTTLGALMKIAGDNGYPRAWAESFFNTRGRSNVKVSKKATVTGNQEASIPKMASVAEGDHKSAAA
ncbi:MAG: hypothetical protein GY847_34715 [Proteobacteria bacterium]|nr:hypothetical protein [Pseudomonadota bacterium]